MKIVKHLLIICAVLFLCLGIPSIYFRSTGALFASVDAVSSASLVVPDQPSGTFYVLLNRAKHPMTIPDWTDFFSEREVGVIMEDISCLVISGDVNGKELAERYLARLAQNQMRMTAEDGTLIVSKAEAGIFDVIILSAEAAESYGCRQESLAEDTIVIEVSGERP